MFRGVLDRSPVASLLLRDDGDALVVVAANRSAATLLDVPLEALEDNTRRSGLGTGDRAALTTAARCVLAGELEEWHAELPVADSSSWLQFALSPAAQPDPDGPGLLLMQVVDRTAERAAHGRLAGERDFVAAVLDTTSCLSLLVDADGTVLHFGRAAERLSGWTADEIVGRPLWETVIAPEARDALRDRFAAGCPEAPCGEMSEWVTRGGGRRSIVWMHQVVDAGKPECQVILTGVDLTEQRLAQGLLESVLQATTGTSIIGTDPDGTITFVNPGAEQMLGYAAEELVGRYTPERFLDHLELAERSRDLDMPPGFGAIVAALNGGASYDRRDWTYIRRDGRRLTVSMTVSAMRDRTGAVTGYLGVAQDVTDERRAGNLLESALRKEQEAVQRLNAVDRAKTDFVATVSHELRTPITSMLGYTELLRDGLGGELSEGQSSLLGRVEKNGDRLLSLVDDLLHLARVESGDYAVTRREVDLNGVARQAVREVEGMLVGRDLDLVLHVAPDPLLMIGDRVELTRVVVNLLTNAVKFTPDPGRVTVTLGRSEGVCRVTVEDTGVGVPAEEQPFLFDRFYRSADAQERQVAGTGLGLAIVRSVVHAHDGEVDVVSTPGIGTTFRVSLPAAPAGG